MMLLGQLTQQTTIAGNVKLTHWDNGIVVNCKEIIGTENLLEESGLGLWNWMPIDRIYAAQDGFLHIDFESK